MAKSWREKLEAPKQKAKVEILDKAFGGIPVGGTLLIAHPLDVKAYIDEIPQGQSRSIAEMREALARKAGADGTCPLTSGIFVRIVAENALEEMAAGKKAEEVSPFWRILDRNSPALKRLSCGPEFVIARRAAEGLP